KGEPSGGGHIARLRLPSLNSPSETDADLIGDRQSALLEVSFQSPPGFSGTSLLHTTLQPPRILRATAGPACWQVNVPANRVLLAPESTSGGERTWTRRGWLLAASLTGATELRDDNESFALVSWQDQSEPIVLTHTPQLAWLLVCSLGLFFVGWMLY